MLFSSEGRKINVNKSEDGKKIQKRSLENVYEHFSWFLSQNENKADICGGDLQVDEHLSLMSFKV